MVNDHSVVLSPPLARSLSSRWWNLRWDEQLPWSLGDVRVECATFGDAQPFMQAHYARIFGSEGAAARFLESPMTPQKQRFCNDSDVFIFKAGSRPVGLFMANPTDWSTYYMRSVAILPEYRDQRLLTQLMERSYEPLRAVGVERIEGECSPANTPMMRMLTGQGFLVTSTAISERWGATIRFTKYLSEEAHAVFLRQFNAVAPARRAQDGRGSQEERSES